MTLEDNPDGQLPVTDVMNAIQLIPSPYLAHIIKQTRYNVVSEL